MAKKDLTYKKVMHLIKKFGLAPSIERNLPLFLISSCNHGYNELLYRRSGLKTGPMVTFGKEQYFYDLINEGYVADQVEKSLDKDPYKTILRPAFKEGLFISKRLIDAPSDPIKALKLYTLYYPEYLSCLGTHNAFHRYTRHHNDLRDMKEALAKKISKERDILGAMLYKKIENVFRDRCLAYGKNNDFDGDLLRYCTVPELKEILKGKKPNILELKKRKVGYLLVYDLKNEYVITDKRPIKKLYGQVFKKIKEVKGHTAYKGSYKGCIHNMHTNPGRMKRGSVLVDIATRPDQTEIVARAGAIVVNEGGILCHAAVVSRELKIPCIIGTKVATRILKHGSYVHVDADNGTVTIIRQAKDH